MTKQIIETGSSANDGTGDTLRTGAQKINANFTELYNSIYSLPIAGEGTAGRLGGVKVDGTSIVINNGVISSTNISNPTASTDNAITRFDGNTGRLLQNSLVTISDLGAIVAPIASSVIPFHYDNQAAFPSAVTYHGAIAHSHADGKMYFAHSGAWVALASASDIPAAYSATSINALSDVDTSSEPPTNGQVLTWEGSTSQWKPTFKAGTGTVISTSVVSANGFAGTVATATSTPAITITTSITGVLKGNGTAISAATSGTDYAPGTGALATGIVKSTTTTGALTIAVAGTDYQSPIGTISGIVKGNGANALAAAVAGTDYQSAQSVTGIVKSSGTTRSVATSGVDYAPGTSALATGIVKSTTTTGALTIAVAGTDYQAPITFTTTGSSGAATFNGTALNIPQYTSLAERNSASVTTASLANDAIGNITITGWKSYMLLSIQTSAAAWVTVYTSSAARTADASRTITTDPTPGSGVIAEVITTGASTQIFSPAVFGFSDETSPSTDIQIKVVNKSGGTTAITITMKLVQLEI